MTAVAVLWLGAAAVTPTTSIEAEAMRHPTGLQYGAYSWDPILWVMTGDGELSERIVTWPGVTRITVVAGGLSTTGVRPRLELFLDDARVAEWLLEVVPLRGWQEPRFGLWGWQEARYVATVRTGLGRPTLRLRVSGTRDHRGSRPAAACLRGPRRARVGAQPVSVPSPGRLRRSSWDLRRRCRSPGVVERIADGCEDSG